MTIKSNKGSGPEASQKIEGNSGLRWFWGMWVKDHTLRHTDQGRAMISNWCLPGHAKPTNGLGLATSVQTALFWFPSSTTEVFQIKKIQVPDIFWKIKNWVDPGLSVHMATVNGSWVVSPPLYSVQDAPFPAFLSHCGSDLIPVFWLRLLAYWFSQTTSISALVSDLHLAFMHESL